MPKKFNRRGGFKTFTTIYRSGLEDEIALQLEEQGVKNVYERYSLSYTIPSSKHLYTPDFVLPNGIIIEAKGIFEAQDRQKHLLIKQQHPDLDIRFVFSNIKTKIYPGSKTTVAQWCEKYGFKYANKSIPPSWFKEDEKPTDGLTPKGGVKDAH